MTSETMRGNGAIWDRPVEGTNLEPGSLGDQLGEGVDLFVFLRHFG